MTGVVIKIPVFRVISYATLFWHRILSQVASVSMWVHRQKYKYIGVTLK